MLSHIRVLDLTEGLGAYTGRLLAELGADVLTTGSARATGSAASLAWNAGKHPVVAADTEGLLRLVAEADIVIRGSANDPVTHEQLSQCNPRLIDVVIAAFDQSGPLHARPATDLTLMARSGLMGITGDPDRAPMKLPGAQAYALAGAQGAVGALTALYSRHASGKGQLVSVSAYQAAVLANYREPLMWQFAGRIGKRTGNLLVRGKSGVRQVWPCLDGYVTWSFVDNPGMMRSLVEVMQAKGSGEALIGIDWAATLIADTPRETLLEWERSVEAFFLLHSKAELSRLSVEHGFGLSQIDEVEDVLASEQLRARSMWRTLSDPDCNLTLQLPGPLFVSAESKPRGST